VDPRERSDEQLRQYLTVVTGYLSLLLEERDREPGPEHWVWLERAYTAAQRATNTLEAADRLRASQPAEPLPDD
jgi:hypothetical protein